MTGEGRTGWDRAGEGEGVVLGRRSPKPKTNQRFFQVHWSAFDRFYFVVSGSLFAFICAQAPRQAVGVFCARREVCLLHLNRLYKEGPGLKGITGVCGTGQGEVGLLGLDRSLWEFRPREAEG